MRSSGGRSSDPRRLRSGPAATFASVHVGIDKWRDYSDTFLCKSDSFLQKPAIDMMKRCVLGLIAVAMLLYAVTTVRATPGLLRSA
jgi:hypothetical protein